jgi:hypothetical protein
VGSPINTSDSLTTRDHNSSPYADLGHLCCQGQQKFLTHFCLVAIATFSSPLFKFPTQIGMVCYAPTLFGLLIPTIPFIHAPCCLLQPARCWNRRHVSNPFVQLSSHSYHATVELDDTGSSYSFQTKALHLAFEIPHTKYPLIFYGIRKLQLLCVSSPYIVLTHPSRLPRPCYPSSWLLSFTPHPPF